MNPLSSLSKWPVDNVAAALVAADGSVETFGDTAKVFPVASLTKLVSAYGIMMAVEEGAVELDGAAGPEGATLRHLLAHASGVGFDSRESQKPVGERRIYSSAGYEWAADTVAEACEMDFVDYLTEGVLEPLGMRDTALRGSAGHGLHSSVQDLAEFAREVLRPQLLSAASFRGMACRSRVRGGWVLKSRARRPRTGRGRPCRRRLSGTLGCPAHTCGWQAITR